MTFTRSDANKPVQMFPGVTRRLISYGERSMAIRVEMAQGSTVPLHSHPHEQIGFVASGKLRFTVAGETRILEPGDGYSIPATALHAVEAHEDSVAIDIFTPVREEYL